jgi:hypothetical protein
VAEEFNESIVHHIHGDIITVHVPEADLQGIAIEPLIQYLLIPGLLPFATFDKLFQILQRDYIQLTELFYTPDVSPADIPDLSYIISGFAAVKFPLS